MGRERVQHARARDFLRDLSPGFLADCLRWKVRQRDRAAYRRWTLPEFSGTPGLGEIPRGQLTRLLATDPVKDVPVAFALVSSDGHAPRGRFRRPWRGHGFAPHVVATDGSGLDPALRAAVWPHAEHPLCAFHALQDSNGQVRDAVRRLRRQRGRRGHAGRRRRGGRQANRRERLTAKEKAHFVPKHRHLVVRRRDNLTALAEEQLRQVLEYPPGLRVLRPFADGVHTLGERSQTLAPAWERYGARPGEAAFASIPGLAEVLRGLTREKFAKGVALPRSPAGGRVRTNSPGERTNRVLRHDEKVRDGWRSGRGVVRFVVVAVERRWRERRGAPGPGLFTPGGQAADPPRTAATQEGAAVKGAPQGEAA
jgi:hypothetical protein